MVNPLRQMVYNKYNGHCAYCGIEIKYKDMQVDHIKAKSTNKPIRRDIYGNYVYPADNDFVNLNPSCRRCNHYKRAESLEVFRNMIKTINTRIHEKYIVKVAEDFGIVQYQIWDGLFYFEKQTNERKDN
jgi:5-methylcytosine-specific restriction endonuclease McrA